MFLQDGGNSSHLGFLFFLSFSLSFFFNFQRGRRRGKGERETQMYIDQLTLAIPQPGPTRNPGMCPDRELNLQPICSWENTQPTESRQSGQPLEILPTNIYKHNTFHIHTLHSCQSTFTHIISCNLHNIQTEEKEVISPINEVTEAQPDGFSGF